MADAPKVTPGMTLVKTFADPTPNGLIVQRLLKTFYTLAPITDMDIKEGQLFMRSLNLTCRKLGSVWSHMDRFKKAQTESVEEMKRERENQPHAHIVDESHALFIEFDEFVVQLKSTLDYLAQIPVPIFGANRWRVNTFGDRGEGFLKTLRGCAPEKYGPGIAVIERHLFGENQKKWLDATIEARDKITHYQRGGVPPEAFAVFVDTNGDVHLPEWATGQTVERFMEVVWPALVFYVEDFLALFLALRLRPGTVFVRKNFDPLTLESPWLAMPTFLADQMAKTALRSRAHLPRQES